MRRDMLLGTGPTGSMHNIIVCESGSAVVDSGLARGPAVHALCIRAYVGSSLPSGHKLSRRVHPRYPVPERRNGPTPLPSKAQCPESPRPCRDSPDAGRDHGADPSPSFPLVRSGYPGRDPVNLATGPPERSTGACQSDAGGPGKGGDLPDPRPRASPCRLSCPYSMRRDPGEIVQSRLQFPDHGSFCPAMSLQPWLGWSRRMDPREIVHGVLSRLHTRHAAPGTLPGGPMRRVCGPAHRPAGHHWIWHDSAPGPQNAVVAGTWQAGIQLRAAINAIIHTCTACM